MFCVDASVILSAARGTETHSPQSKRFFATVAREGQKLFLPEIVLPAIASGLMRATGNASLTRDFVDALRGLPNVSLVPVDHRLSMRAVNVILHTSLKSADALYVALAFEYSLPLITLDREQLRRGGKLVMTREP
jgi:predicted nucleic acid-binding protein